MVSVRRRRLLVHSLLMPLLSVVLLASGCTRSPEHVADQQPPAPPPAQPAASNEDVVKTLAEFNRGAAQLEQYQYAAAAKTFESVVKAFPAWTAARFNLGVALLNEKGSHERAIAEFKRVLEVDSGHLPAHFCIGVLAYDKGDFQEAVEHFGKVHAEDPDDPFVGFEYAETLHRLNRDSEALPILKKVVERDPGFISAFYSLGRLYIQSRQREKAAQAMKRFKELDPQEVTGGSHKVVSPYSGMGKYYMVLTADGLPIPPESMSPAPRVIFSPEIQTIDCPLQAWSWTGGKVAVPGIAVGDLDGDGDQDVVLCGAGKKGETVVLRNDGKGKFSVGKPLADQGVSPCLGDIDNDGDLDLWLGRAGQDLIFLGDGKGNLVQAPKQPEPAGELLTTCARLVDLDSDGDLDLLANRIKKGSVPPDANQAAAASVVFNNNLDGTFSEVAKEQGLAFADTPISAVVTDDLDNDRDIDMALVSSAKPPLCWQNFRVGQFRLLDGKETHLDLPGASSVTTGNPFKTGNRDLLLFDGKELALYHNRGLWKFERDSEFSGQHGTLGGTGGQFVDIDNDGDLDIVIADAHRQDGTRGPALLLNDWPKTRFVNAASADPGIVLTQRSCPGDAVCVAADFNGDGKVDLLHAPMGGSPVLIANMTQGGNWLALDLEGKRIQDKSGRSPNSAVGARVELRSGNVTQQFVVGTPAGATAMPPLRVQAGIGAHTSVDWLRVRWPDSVLQAELEVAGNQVATIPEANRRPSSCPHLFAWDGRRFAFVSDFGGVGGLGYRTGPSSFARPDPTEYVVLPPLAPRDGDYTLQVVEPLEEIVYLDEVSLIAVDHPAGTSVHPNELAAVSASFPPFQLFCYSEIVQPTRAADDRGRDVTSELLKTDRIYAGPTQRDGRFTGYAREHFIELDFGDKLQTPSPRSRWVLFLDGWVEYSTSTSNFAASQAGLRLKAPSISVLRDGRWVDLLHEVGYPAGINHTMTLDLTGKLLPGDRKIRVTTNMDLSWDRVFLAAHRAEVPLKLTEVAARSGDLHYLGFPREFSPDGRRPNLLDYANIDPSDTWQRMPGAYTRYGDVTELVHAADDRFVILAAGDEVTLRFPASAFGPVPPGWARTFLLKSDSFCKDMDMYTGGSESVEPLPFHAMTSYPYGSNEHYPATDATRGYRRKFNTRFIQGPAAVAGAAPRD
ncbi:MAG: FG-GAP-like repeat-containing protein [Isosphaeraceae bacterium]